MADRPYVVVINDYSGLTVEERTRKSGKTHVTMSISAEPIAVNLDPMLLGKGPANALAEVIRRQIAGIGDQASAETLLKRKYAESAFSRGESWATKRYSGGRTGALPPGKSDRAYNDSGRLAGGVVAMANPQEKAWTINVPANRLDPSTFRGGAAGAAFQAMVKGLVDRVPALTRPFAEPEVVAAVNASIDIQVGKAVDASDRSAIERWKTVVEALQFAERVLG